MIKGKLRTLTVEPEYLMQVFTGFVDSHHAMTFEGIPRDAELISVSLEYGKIKLVVYSESFQDMLIPQDIHVTTTLFSFPIPLGEAVDHAWQDHALLTALLSAEQVDV